MVQSTLQREGEDRNILRNDPLGQVKKSETLVGEGEEEV